MKNLEIGNEASHKALSEFDLINLTEWLIFKIKIIYGRPIFEGDTPEEASAIRQEWQDLTLKIGKKGVLATIDYFLSGHHAVPSFPPSPVEFRKCYRLHISSSLTKGEFQKKSPPLTREQKQIGYQRIKELLDELKTGCLGGKTNIKNSARTGI
jgi:hypothetical protein